MVSRERDETDERWTYSYPRMEVRQAREGWTITYGFSADGGRLRVTSIQIEPADGSAPYRGLSANLLRRVSISRALWQMRKGMGSMAMSSLSGIEGWAALAESITGQPGWAEAWRTEIRPQFRSRAERRAVAGAVYVAAVADRRPAVQAVAEFLQISRAQAGELIRGARIAGVLSATEGGKAGGELAPASARLAGEWMARHQPG